jgi:hypothetical protein
MWKVFCRKTTIFQGLPDFEQENQQVINILCVGDVENSVFYANLHFSVFCYFYPKRGKFTFLFENLSLCSVFSFSRLRVFYEERIRAPSFVRFGA